jgi:hypothetical protein
MLELPSSMSIALIGDDPLAGALMLAHVGPVVAVFAVRASFVRQS